MVETSTHLGINFKSSIPKLFLEVEKLEPSFMERKKEKTLDR